MYQATNATPHQISLALVFSGFRVEPFVIPYIQRVSLKIFLNFKNMLFELKECFSRDSIVGSVVHQNAAKAC